MCNISDTTTENTQSHETPLTQNNNIFLAVITFRQSKFKCKVYFNEEEATSSWKKQTVDSRKCDLLGRSCMQQICESIWLHTKDTFVKGLRCGDFQRLKKFCQNFSFSCSTVVTEIPLASGCRTFLQTTTRHATGVRKDSTLCHSSSIFDSILYFLSTRCQKAFGTFQFNFVMCTELELYWSISVIIFCVLYKFGNLFQIYRAQRSVNNNITDCTRNI